MPSVNIAIKQTAPSLNLKSFDGGKEGSTQITNNLNYSVQLYWVNPSGVEIKYETISPNNIITRSSAAIGHAWRIKDLNGNFIAEFYGDTQSVVLSSSEIIFSFPDLQSIKYTIDDSYIKYTLSQISGSGVINVAKALGLSYVDTPINNLLGSFDNSGALKFIKGYDLWKKGFDGTGITVAVIGTGIDSKNIEFGNHIINGYDFGENDNDSSPLLTGSYAPHETGIASIIVGSPLKSTGIGLGDVIGIAPNVSILNIKNTLSNGSGTDSTIAQSIRYAVDHGAKVISLSQGGSAKVYKSDELYSAAKYAQDNNVLICVAAGNLSLASVIDPAYAWIGLNNFIVVGNWSIHDNKLFTTSNTIGVSSVPWVSAPSSGWAAQLNNSYVYFEDGGTSYATPYVSGLAALIFQQHPSWTPAQVIERITSTASLPYVTSSGTPTVSYSLVATSSSINEGSTATFTLTTTNITSGTSVPYTLTGISAADVSGGALSGSAVVNTSGVSTISVTLLNDALTEGPETLTVTAGGAMASTVVNDTSTAGTRTYIGTSGNDLITGTSSINIVKFQSNISNYSIVKNSNGWTVSDKTGKEGIDALVNIQRLQFSDSNIALDIDKNAGQVIKILGAVFGSNSIIEHPDFIGIGLKYLDSGMTYSDLSVLALNATGVKNTAQIINLLWTNVFNSTPNSSQSAPYIKMLDEGTFTKGDFMVMVEDSFFNTTNINLIGISNTGINYIPFIN